MNKSLLSSSYKKTSLVFRGASGYLGFCLCFTQIDSLNEKQNHSAELLPTSYGVWLVFQARKRLWEASSPNE